VAATVDLSEGSIARSLRIATSRETQEWTYPSDDPFETEITEFVEAIQSQRDPTPGVEDGLASLAVILAAYESARSGRAVDFRAWQKAYKPC
jgi:predicted dehydrogenase